MRCNRRQLLQALGLGTASLALPRVAFAGERPKRLIVLSHGHGVVHDRWRTSFGNPDDREWQHDLLGTDPSEWSDALRPLYDYRDRLTICDGLSLATGELDVPGYRHEKGWIQAWTGGWAYFTGSALFSEMPSLDQLVARQIARPDRLPSLELTIDEGRPIVHAGRAQQLPMEGDPAKVWERLFGLSTSDDPTLTAQGSVLDFAHREYESLIGKISRVEQARLGDHFDLVRQLEQRIAGLRTASCEAPARPTTASAYDAQFTTMAELITAAFACDLTRVVSLSLGDLPGDAFGYPGSDVHDGFAHSLYSSERSAIAMTDYVAHHAKQVAELVAMLEAVPDGDGSLMDHTLIVWGTELGDGWHGFERYGAVMLGGGWAWQTGRQLHWPYGTTPIEMLVPGGYRDAGLPHQHLLVSAANAMGLAVDHVGLAEVQGQRGDRVRLTGGLPGL